MDPEIELHEWIQIDLNIRPPQTQELLHSLGEGRAIYSAVESWPSVAGRSEGSECIQEDSSTLHKL